MASVTLCVGSFLLALSGLAVPVSAGFPPTPEGLTTIQSKVNPGVSLSYKETSICETTSGVKGFSGYVHLPPNATEGRQYNISTFFWFFEARNNPKTAPLTLWLQGGPGVPSITAAVGENGPCNVTEDSVTTTLNPFSWNTNSNMLYVDQPVQVGFSYDTLVNGTIDEVQSPSQALLSNGQGSALPPENGTIRHGTFSSQNNATTANTTQQAAQAIWNFMQTWTQEFPEYKPPGNKLSIWTESYGGHYGPTFADYFESQNDLIAKGNLPGATPLNMETLGLINACVDALTQLPSYPQMMFNNTYPIKVINQSTFDSANAAFPQCQNLTQQCRSLVASKDPQGLGNNDEVNKACADANAFCFAKMHDQEPKAGVNMFDIAQPTADSFPPKYAAGYFNTREVQQALGVPVNFTGESPAVSFQFGATGDFMRDGNLQAISRLLDRGVKVAFMYGDRDFQCNWIGGEAVSLALNASISKDFANAGYTNIQNGNSVGGMVRQYGNLSFSRIFEAGHSVPYFQPETAQNVFNRVMFNKDVATGKESTDGASTYATKGNSSTFNIKDDLPAPAPSICYTWDVAETCTKQQAAILDSGSAIIKNFILVGYKASNGSTVMFNQTAGGGAAPGSASGSASGNTPHSAAAIGVSSAGAVPALAATVFACIIGLSLHIV